MERDGILHKELIDLAFKKLGAKEQSTKEDLLAMMELYGLIAKFPVKEKSGEDTMHYFVPAQLTSSPEELSRLEPRDGDPCVLYVDFEYGFVPHGLFPQVVSRLIPWCSKFGCNKDKLKLYCNAVRCILGSGDQFDLALCCSKRFIKVVLRSSKPERSTQVKSVMDASIPIQVRSFLEETLLVLKGECCWLGNMEYKLSVMCAACAAPDKLRQQHGVVSCLDDDSLHLVQVTSGCCPTEQLACLKMFGDDARFTVSGLNLWYSEESPKVFLVFDSYSYALFVRETLGVV